MSMGGKKQSGWLANILAFFLLVGLCGWGFKSCGDWLFAPETPEQAERREQREAKEAERRQQEEAAEAERWRQEEAKQADRKEAIQELLEQRVFRKVELRELGATIWVDQAFYALDFEAKQTFCSVVHGYIATNARTELVSVTLKDARTGKTVGDYGQQWDGLGLKME
jgi:hypothetical protein